MSWIGWVISWVAASRWSNATVSRAAFRRQWTYLLLEQTGFALLLGYVLIGGTAQTSLWFAPLWHVPPAIQWLCVALCALSIGFMWWARLHLGRLWSSTVTRKQDHRLVDTGPYAIVRHPIYSGLIAAALSTAVLRATVLPVAGSALILAAYICKSKVEERWLSEELGTAAYDAYRRRVPMLIPFVRF